MKPGNKLIKKRLLLPKKPMERVAWLIRLRWTAVIVALAGIWACFFREQELSILPLSGLLLFVALYNLMFHFIGKRIQSPGPGKVKSFAASVTSQIFLDLLALYFFIYFTGGIYSPLLILTIFHIILAGTLLSPLSYLLYVILSITSLGGFMIMHASAILPPKPIFFQNRLFPDIPASYEAIFLYLSLTVLLSIAAFMVSILKPGSTAEEKRGKEPAVPPIVPNTSNPKLTALNVMVKEMGLCTNLQELMDSATRNAAEIMQTKGCSIKLLDDQRKRLGLTSTYGLGKDFTSEESIDIEKNVIDQKIIKGSFHLINEINENDYHLYTENLQGEKIVSIAGLPLKVEKIALGVFYLYSSEINHFADSDVKFFSLMADLTALAIENLKSELDRTWFLQKSVHQLRSPFNAIYSMLKMVRRGYLGPINQEQEKTIKRCEKRIEMLGDLIKDLLKLGLKRADINKTIVQPVDIAEVMKVSDNLYRTQALEKDLKITFDIEEPIPPIMADEKLIEELFGNLISNAIKYTPAGGKVRISLSREDRDQVRFEVSDTGIGIPENDIPHLFSEFFRAVNAKAFTEDGTGLGLVIVREILDRLKGTISVKSKIGEGTCFTCFFPSVQI